MREYAFELRLCAHLESSGDHVVARQLGGGVHAGGRRVLDTVVVDRGSEFDRRRAITSRTIPAPAIESDVGPGRSTRWATATDTTGRTADEARETAIEVGFFESDPHRGPGYVRQTTRYPDWFETITAIEHKPDLSTPGSLSTQLRTDVALGLVDRVILATASHVTGAHLHRIPEEVGVWRMHSDDGMAIEERRAPTALDPSDWGIELGERTPTARAIRPVSPTAKRRARIRLAERAYGRGWRPALPACSMIRPADETSSRCLPYCDWKERLVDPGRCGPACPGHEPAAPPAVDATGERADRTPWDPDPQGLVRHQTGIDAYSSDS